MAAAESPPPKMMNDGQVAVRHGLGHRKSSLGKVGHFKHAHGAVPHNRAGFADDLGEILHCLRADIQDAPAVRNRADINDLGLSVIREFVGNYHIHRQTQL